MKQETDEWDFKGGFNKKTYAIICKELNLKNKNIRFCSCSTNQIAKWNGSAWAVGFLRAVEMAPDSWDAMLDEKEFGDALDAAEALAATLDDESGARAPSRREREALIDRMIADVGDIHEFFRPYRQAGTTPRAMRVETVRREQPKVGRNEPCPCGSGRKFKACCGASPQGRSSASADTT